MRLKSGSLTERVWNKNKRRLPIVHAIHIRIMIKHAGDIIENSFRQFIDFVEDEHWPTAKFHRFFHLLSNLFLIGKQSI